LIELLENVLLLTKILAVFGAPANRKKPMQPPRPTTRQNWFSEASKIWNGMGRS
jgi:hypothetical protein